MDRIKDSVEQKQKSQVRASTLEDLEQRVKQLEKDQFDIGGAVKFGQGLLNKFR